MGKLNQVIAVLGGKKKAAAEALTVAYHKIQKGALFDGLSRTYQPKDEEGERFPPETKTVQVTVADLVREVRAALTEAVDLVATQDRANTQAVADVRVEGSVVLGKVPVTHLLYLEKQLTDLETFVGKLPTLDPSETWVADEASGYWATRPSETVKTKKVPKAFVRYEATKEHPAQVETFHEDVVTGHWKTVKFSGAIPVPERSAILDRVRQLREAVVKAREEANGMEVLPVSTEGKAIFDFVFGK